MRKFCDLATVAMVRTNAQKKISYRAYYDALTGLPNRESLSLNLHKEMEKLHCGEKIAIISIDMDDLKSVNDNFGHS